MACCLLSPKPLSEPMEACGTLDLRKQFSVKFETIFLQYNEFEYVICKMAAILSRPQCVFVFVFVFDGLYLYLYLIRFSPVYLYLYLKLWEKMYLYWYLYLIKRIWPQPCIIVRMSSMHYVKFILYWKMYNGYCHIHWNTSCPIMSIYLAPKDTSIIKIYNTI